MPSKQQHPQALTQTDPAYIASRQWIMAGIVGVTFGVTLLTTYGLQASLTQYSALAAIGVGVIGVLLLAPWKQTRQIMDERRQLRAMTDAIRRAVRDGRPVPQQVLAMQRADTVGELSRAIAELSQQQVRARIENRQLQRNLNDEMTRSAGDMKTKRRPQTLRDPLTGLASRRQFERYISDVCADPGESDVNIGVLRIEIEHLPVINNTLDEHVSDQCLVYLARLLSNAVQRRDLAARLHDDTFIVAMHDRTAEQMRDAADQLRLSYMQMTWDHRTVPRPTLRTRLVMLNAIPNDHAACTANNEPALQRGVRA